MLGSLTWSLMLPFVLGAVQDEPSWKVYTYKNGGFAAAFPKMPTESTQRVKSATGELKVHLYVAEGSGEVSYVVSWTDLPAKEARKGTEQKRLDFAQGGAVSSSRGKLRSSTKRTIDGHPGRELIIDGPGESSVRVRLYVVGRRLFQVLAVGPGSAASRQALHFLDSFRLIR